MRGGVRHQYQRICWRFRRLSHAEYQSYHPFALALPNPRRMPLAGCTVPPWQWICQVRGMEC